MHSSLLRILTLAVALLWPALGLSDAPAALGQAGDAGRAEALVLYADMRKWVEDATALEKDAVKALSARLQDLRSQREAFGSEVKSHNIRLSTYSSLLLVPSTDPGQIEKSWKEAREAVASIAGSIDRIENDLKDIERQMAETGQQTEARRKQLTDIEAVSAKDREAAPLIAGLKALMELLVKKNGLLTAIQEIDTQRLDELRAVATEFNALAFKFEQHLRREEQARILQRERRPEVLKGLAQVAAEMGILAMALVQKGLSPAFWGREARELWNSAGLLTLSLLIVLAAMLWGLGRLRAVLIQFSNSGFCSRFPAHRLFCVLIGRSLVPAGLAVFLYACTRVDALSTAAPSLKPLLSCLLAWLTTKWGMDGLRAWAGTGAASLPASITQRLRLLLTTIRAFALAYAFLSWFLAPPSVLLNLLRLAFILVFIALAVSLGRSVAAAAGDSDDGPPKKGLRSRAALPAALKLIAAGGFVADLAGFANLTTFWFLSWGLSAIVWFWWYLFFRMLAEWRAVHREKRAGDADASQVADTLQWLSIRMGELAWGLSLLALMLVIWGGKQDALAIAIGAMGHSIQVGNMQFSLLGILSAALVLLATHVLASVWRHVFQTKILGRSDLEAGLQASITTITVYAVWAFGILVALHVFGLNTASMAVAFGALGIGLGFGLQNIFNNFISGIILLFERPIQVGDDVEINGVWATVKKINVRATIVQTYDNASLIIPNSEFISNQVTNWSFKDKRLRRRIGVGVAYGSDTEKVRETLLEIAGNTSFALKYPRPSVLFRDFGDNALIFELRVWTDIDHMLEVETAIRFDIDRLFRERGIEMAFPQMDLHIKSMPEPTRGIPPEDMGR